MERYADEGVGVPRPMPVIDIHHHAIPDWLVAEARAGSAPGELAVQHADGEDWLVHPQGYRYPIARAFHDSAARLAAMADLGIDAAVVSVSPTIYGYELPAESAIPFASHVNDWMAGHVADSPTQLAGLATLPMQAPEAAARELERAVRELGLRGASIGPVVGEIPLDDPSIGPVLGAAESLDVPLLLHPYYVGLRPGLPDFYLTNLIGNPLETTISVARLILSGCLDRRPRLRFVLVHAGGFIPYQVGRLDHGWEVRAEVDGSTAPPSSYLRRFVFDTITHDPAALAYLIGRVGADRVAYGTDFPFDMMDGALDAQLAGTRLTDDQHKAIASATAEATFGRIHILEGAQP